MTNIVESSTWESGVYQFETADPIQGGVDGVDNLPHKQLGNRTLWLKTQVDALNALKGKTIPQFSAVTAYASGEIVSYSGNIYRANSALAAGVWNASNWTALVYNIDATKLNGQLPAYYLDLTNATGTLASARLTGTYAISVSGNSATATTLQTARTITLGGDLSGSASFNGSANITITATVADSSHLHDYSNLLNAPVKDSVLVATTVALTVTYANGTAGVGATLTNTGTLAALAIDGVTLAVNDRVLVKNQAAPAQNGIYTVTNIGSASVAWVMTRGTNADTNAELAGCLVCVDKGTVNGGLTYKTTFESTDTVGTTACVWTSLATTDSSITGNAATATILQNTRTIALSGGATGTATSFNGSANIAIPVTALNASVLTGIVPLTSLSGTYASASIGGNAATATKLATARTITLSTDATGSVSFDGSGNVTLAVTVVANSHNHTSANITDATNLNTASMIVKRDASGNFSAGTITAALSGNATTATTLQTARTINGVSFNGSANITVADATKLPLTGGNLSGGVNITTAATINTLSTAQATLSGSNGAIMCFNRPGVFTAGFGVDANNDLVYGGNNSSLGTTHKVWHDGVAGGALGSSGWQKLPSGWIIQWGLSPAIASGANGVITLPTTFPNTIDRIVATLENTSGDLAVGSAAAPQIRAYSASSITIRNLLITSAQFSYFCIGR